MIMKNESPASCHQLARADSALQNLQQRLILALVYESENLAGGTYSAISVTVISHASPTAHYVQLSAVVIEQRCWASQVVQYCIYGKPP
jgi:hypothetical protein